MTQLREPRFLNGRKNMPIRVLCVCLVLGGAAFFAGFVPVSCHLLLHQFGFVPRPRMTAAADTCKVLTAICVAMGVVPLYSHWLRQTSVETAIRTVWLAWLMMVPTVWGEAAYSMLTEAYLQFSHRYTLLFPEWRMNEVSQMTILWLGLCTAYFRWSWQWLCCTALSLVGVMFAGKLDAMLPQFWVGLQTWIGADSTAYDLIVIVDRSARYGQCLALVVIPWGLPLWFSPKQAGRITSTDFRDS